MGTQSPLCFTLGRNAVYKADEVVATRKYKGQHDETLVKWVTISAFAPASESTDKAVRREEPKEYLVWMRNEEMRACCPHLVSTTSLENGLGATGVSASYETGLESEDSMQEMAADVRSLVDRTKRIVNGTRYGGKCSGKHLSNTITILGAYTKIPCLADTFRECGALDLLLSLLSSQDTDARKSSNDMLRSLVACDPASRAYVFLQLAKEEDAQNNAANASSSPENHRMLLDLFAETASIEELGPILSGVTFPQVPGRFLFSLLKKYLRVTSTARKDPTDNNSQPLLSSSSSSSSSFHPSSAKFDAFFHTFQLVTELFSVFSWYEVDQAEQNLKGTSIFTGTTATDMAASSLKRERCAFKKRSDFQTEQEYALYVKDNMRPGMRVKAVVTYESVREGDRGEYRQTNNGTPPAQFAWDGLGGETYWVYWHQVELLPLERGQQESDGEVIPHSTVRQPYILKALARPLEKGVQQDHWWELLCLLKAVPSPHIEEICSLMGDPHIKCFNDLVDLLPSLDKVGEVLSYLDMRHPHLSQELLSVRRLAHLHNCTPATPACQNLQLTLPQATPTYRTHPPYPDPYDVEPPLAVKKPPAGSRPTPPPPTPNDPLSFLQSLTSLQGFLRNRQEEVDPSAQLQVLQERIQEGSGSPILLDEIKLTVDGVLNKHSKSCRLALQSLLVVRAGAQSTRAGTTLVEFSGKGFVSLVLRLMHQSPTSCSLQCVGLECLYLLVGGASLDREFLNSGTKPTLADPVGTLAMVALYASFCRGDESESVRGIAQAVCCVLDNYNLQMSATQKKYCVAAVEHGLILLCLLLLKDDIAKAMKDWNIDWLLDKAQHKFPNFPAKNPLCRVLAVGLGLPYSGGTSAEPVTNDDETERPADLSGKIAELVTWVVGALRNTKDLQNKNPLSRLLDLVYPDQRDPFTHSVQLVCPPPPLSSLFLAQRGVYFLGRALEVCHSQSLSESAAILLGCLVLAGREEAAQVILQGGLRTLLECMRLQESNKQIQLLCCRVLDLIAKDSDNLAVMAAESVGVQMAATMDKFKDEEEICRICIHLIEMCGSEMVARAELHTRILATIFSGVLKLTLDAIEDSRRDRESVCIPKLAAFMRYMSTGSGGPLKSGSKESGFDKAEVSSNSFRLQKLFDGDSSTYWESSGRSGTHWIRLHFHHGMVIKRLAIEVNANDSSYMPQKITIQGGISSEAVTDLCTVNIPATFNGYYDLLANAKKHYPVVVIRIKRCHQGGIDTRVHGLTCQCIRASLWPVFGDLLSARTKLFYYIQMHTWLADPTLQPLELFDRLNFIITHEQTFADLYLWSGLARRCLGQACRVSLITPLIERLTQVGQNGTILGSMIQCYVSQIRATTDPTWKLLLTSDPSEVDMSSSSDLEDEDPNMATAIHTWLVQCSRTRRLCRLLVECDSTTSGGKLEGEGDEEWAESGGVVGVGPGTAAMSACWREVVSAELLQALQRFECSASPHAVAADLICVYDRLKQAMVELFGGHSNFALGMKEGFTKAFQSLDEVTGVKFSESLCLCIESLMDCGSKESHRLHLNISESKREALLLRLAEPLQFMHSLDLAHIFEHYYRRHLSLRLLQGRSISVPLERRLAHAFAHCFPHKYPLQMLTDLEESSTMMDRFCDSELLESIDRLMAQVASPDLVTSEAVELAQKCSFYRQHKLQVFTLNPCYWSLRHRPLPSPSHLPKPLGSFCEDYERFFTTVRAYGLQQHEKARRLHWTLHGWALVRYGRLSLAITTTQMMVLLQFNQAQELSFKQLQESTQLSEAELCNALLALTSEHQEPLLLLLQMPLTQTSSSSIDSKTSSMLEEEGSLQDTPFKPNTTLKLNEDFGRSLAKVRSSSVVRFQDLRLVTRIVGDVPDQEERAVSLAHVFERRRAIIDSAIVRLLKKEKEMSVDNIAMQIIKGCGAGKFDQGASFGRFECTFRDVCSRINRLVLDSYVKRDENNQHMLAYIQDPMAASEKEAEGGAETQPSCSKGLKEDVGVATLNPSATHSDSAHGLVAVETKDKVPTEEPEQLEAGQGGPQQTCASPSRPHSRKRPGASKPPVVRLKRKPHVSWMCGGCGGGEREDLPLVTMFTSTNSKGVGDVQNEIDQNLYNISQVLHVDVDTVEHLLTFCHWNKDNLIQRYLQDSTSLLKEAGLDTSDDASPSPPDGEPVLCPVCLQCVLREESCWLWCAHACCISCWRHHLLAQIEANVILQSSCPTSGCHARVTRRFFVQLLGEEPEAMKKFNMAVVRSYVEGSGLLTWCRNPQGCDQVLCKGDGIGSGTCQKCQWSSCFSCSHTEAHQPASCSDMTKWVEAGGFYEGMGEDAKSKQLANMISKRCPSCNAQIEKNEGCLHMKCKCGHGFCWKCLKPWKPTHSDYYNCLSKIGKAAHDHKKFADVNQRCIAHHRSKAFAEKLGLLVKGITEVVPIRNLTFIMDACRWLFECHKMLGYACVAEYFSQPDASAYLWLLSEQLEGDTNALQALLENTLLSVSDVAHTVRTLPERKLSEGYRLVGKIESTREKVLLGFHQQFKLGEVARQPTPRSEQAEATLVQDPDTDSSRPAFGHLGNLMSQDVSASDHDVPEDEDHSGEGEEDDDDDDDLEDDDIYSDYDDQFIYDSNEYYDSDYSL